MLDRRVQSIAQPPGRVRRGRAMQVVNQWHAGHAGGNPSDQRRPRRVAVDQPITLLRNQSGNPPGDAQIEPRSHAHVP